jgi:hypothetical protein
MKEIRAALALSDQVETDVPRVRNVSAHWPLGFYTGNTNDETLAQFLI